MRSEAAGPLGRGAGANRVDSGQRLVDHERQRVHVGRGSRFEPLGLLGRHIGRGADDVAGECQRLAPDHPGDAEVGELRDPGSGRRPIGHQHVGGLDVAVDDALGMGVLERVGQRDRDRDHVAVRHPAGLEQIGQRPASDQLGDEVGALVVDLGLVQGHDPRMRQACRGSSLALEPAAEDPRPRDDFDGHLAVQPLVARQPHGAERPGAKPAVQPVPVEHDRRLAPRRTARRVIRGGATGDRWLAGADAVHFHAGPAVPLGRGCERVVDPPRPFRRLWRRGAHQQLRLPPSSRSYWRFQSPQRSQTACRSSTR